MTISAPIHNRSTLAQDIDLSLYTALTQSLPHHPMFTHEKSKIVKLNPNYNADFASLQQNPLHVTIFSDKEPCGFKSVVKDPKWLSAIKEEMHALRSNHTWVLVPRPTGLNVVGSKWVFWTKYNYDGSLDRFKARLVAQGFTQVPSFDYALTFTPVVKAFSVRIV
ncbi:unnamed protein product [Lactuca virosa]|uniref:Reverse transcriptase Ty1/copia-type domain-containing protein n=1 Tax=Lactuca virosa TaxID=75947 RepID=A0AAU9MKY2_9ASTR|nr:unnamed protein product [Lactuca virosa]